MANPEISVVEFLEDGILSDNDLRARELTLTHAQYEVIDDVLYHIEPDKTLWIVLPTVGLFLDISYEIQEIYKYYIWSSWYYWYILVILLVAISGTAGTSGTADTSHKWYCWY